MNSKIKFLIPDFDIQLYTPHREFILNELFKNNNSYRLNLSNIDLNQIVNVLRENIESKEINTILFDPWIFFNDKRDLSFNKANLIVEKNLDQKCEIISNFFLNDFKSLKIILGSWMDVHSLSNNSAKLLQDLLKREDFYFWGLSEEDYKYDLPIDKNTNEKKRNFTKYFNDLILNNNVKKKIIPYLHSIPSNFNSIHNNANNSQYEFSFHVPGSTGSYKKRSQILNKILEKNIDNYDNLVFLNQTIRQTFVQIKSKKFLDLINYTYYDLIKKSRVNYVDGGDMNYVTMKYLEVPLCNSIILSPEILSLDKYGFIPNKHYVPYTNQDIETIINDDFFQKNTFTITNSKNLIYKFHTTEIRSNQFIYMIEKILDNEYNSYFYSKGLLYDGNGKIVLS